ncbi:MAG: T9SS type A sorting domain-containing protein [Chitinophagaceae bacterium]
MRSMLLLLLTLLTASALSGQVVITPGAQFFVGGNEQLTLHNTSLVNNGGFIAGNGIVSFTGTANSSISGSVPPQFYELQINKSNGSSVVLLRSIIISQRIQFTSGFLNLNGFDADLGTTGYLQGEQENSRVAGGGGGQVLFATTLNAPSGANPGNLGAIITSTQNLGNVIIRRGHQSQTNGAGLGSSVLRYYDISTTNNTGLNATLRMHYFDGELNAINENSLVFFKNEDGTNWTNQGFAARNTTENWVEKTGINSFRSWTLSGAGNALPVQFTLFNVRCEGSKAIITWKTAQEQNSSRFDVQKSADGVQWTVIESLAAAGNSIAEKSYSYADNNPGQNNYYRIAAYDVDGKIKYTSVLRASCSSKDVFKLWPNPSHGVVFVNIVTDVQSMATLSVFDARGALVKLQKANALQGSNQFSIDLGTLPNGAYSVSAEWNNGKMKQTTQVLKQ